MSTQLRDLPNIGAVLAAALEKAGITTPGELAALGSRQAFLRLREQDPGACANKLLALEGALWGVRWHSLPTEVKTELKQFYKSTQGGQG